MKNQSTQELQKLCGKRVVCINMPNDPLPIQSGTLGTITYIDDLPQVHVSWDNGSTLALIPNVDSYRVLDERKLWVFNSIDFHFGGLRKLPTQQEAEEYMALSIKQSEECCDERVYSLCNEEEAIWYCENYGKDFDEL